MRTDIEQTSIRAINQVSFVNLDNLLVMMEMVLGLAINCDNTENIIASFTDRLDDQSLDDLMQITKEVLEKYGKREPEDDEEEENYEENESFTMNGTFNAKSNVIETSNENFDEDEEHKYTVVDGLHGASPGIDDNSGLFDQTENTRIAKSNIKEGHQRSIMNIGLGDLSAINLNQTQMIDEDESK